jgi:hypothetical protein
VNIYLKGNLLKFYDIFFFHSSVRLRIKKSFDARASCIMRIMSLRFEGVVISRIAALSCYIGIQNAWR